MPGAVARFRLSIKDNTSRWGLKGELVDVPGRWGERRYQIRVNGKEAEKIREATVTEVFEHLRRWVVGWAEGVRREWGNFGPPEGGTPNEGVGGQGRAPHLGSYYVNPESAARAPRLQLDGIVKARWGRRGSSGMSVGVGVAPADEGEEEDLDV